MANVHLFIGEDDYLVCETAKKIVGDGTGLEVIDSINSTNADLQLADIREVDASFSTPPFLDPRKVTWWKNVHFLPGGGGKKATAEEVKKALEKFAKKLAAAVLPENQHFILTAPNLLRTSLFAKQLAGTAEIVTFGGSPREREMTALRSVEAWAPEMNLTFAPGALECFVSHVGTDSRSLLSELGKMRDYLGGEKGIVREADIEAVTSQGVGVEQPIWAVTDRLAKRDLAGCLAALKPFEGDKSFAVLVTSVVENFFRQMIDVANKAPTDIPPYARQKMVEAQRLWSLRELRVARARFLLLRERAVTTSGGADALVITELVRVCRRQPVSNPSKPYMQGERR